uniref:Uncharacterized protein n=1 Tax=Rhizophagus irregularis (strain DAOM 181602 / DAOM 197198 / MUCL 43194) TaxID=747089 RepID=U9U5R3_RHIID
MSVLEIVSYLDTEFQREIGSDVDTESQREVLKNFIKKIFHTFIYPTWMLIPDKF